MKNNIKNIAVLFISVGLITILSVSAFEYSKSKGKDIDQCLACHEDRDLFMESGDKKISVFVNPDLYKESVHGNAECTDCHLKYNPDEIPHSTDRKLANCSTCHDDLKGIENSVHAKTDCYDCHSKHNVRPAKELEKEGSKNCLSCHKKGDVAKFSSSIHGKKGVECSDCHQGGHSVKKISRGEVTNLCGKCHSESKMKFSNSIHQTLTKSGNMNTPICTDCHGAHKIINNKFSIESEGCLKCHLNEKLFPGDSKGSAKFVAEYKTSIHASINGSVEAAGCVDCHGNHMIQDPNNSNSSTSKYRLTETCAKCHKDVADKFLSSAHGKALRDKNVAAPTCVSCHNEHSIKSVSSEDNLSKLNQVELCLKCHEEGKLPHKNYKGEEELIRNYKQSYHYKALQEGKDNAATCSDCHGAHDMNKFDNPDSRVNKNHIANTCGQVNCHAKEFRDFEGSIHNTSLNSKPDSDAPTCTGCHGNHQIFQKDASNNRLANSKGLVQLCSDCHNSVELTSKYKLPVGRTESYLDSYHGLAVRGGSKVAADCGSCHGNHNIRASKDSLSSINKNNLAKTCGKCHPGAEQTFFLTKIHIVDELKDSPFVFWITLLYILLIAGTIGLMIWHNYMDIKKKIQEQE
ncbi:MAG: cytochrome c3 family protein [Bacteroidetes bacterium]|nr:cytochrome c3 family protein [Bacteroidota bacterium]